MINKRYNDKWKTKKKKNLTSTTSKTILKELEDEWKKNLETKLFLKDENGHTDSFF